MFFTYWENETTAEPPSAEAWRAHYPGFIVFSDKDVLPLLGTVERRELYEQIVLPACKSDIARLLLLREHGGLYVDAHAGPTDGARLAETMDALSKFEMILFCRAYEKKTPEELHLMNGAIAARAGTVFLDMMIDTAFEHLFQHIAAERATADYVHYTLWGLAGTWIMLKNFFDMNVNPYALRPEFASRILVRHIEDPPSAGFQVYLYYGYRGPGQHWSERQKTERLFGPHRPRIS